MKFTILGPVYPFRGGIAHYTYFLDRALQGAGQQTQLISFRRQYPNWLYPGASDKDPSQSALQSHASYLLDPLYPWTWTKALRSIMDWKPDTIVFQWWTTFWGPAFAFICRQVKKQGISPVFIIHNVLPHEQRFFDQWLARLALSEGKAFIAQTDTQKVRLQSLLPEAFIEVCSFPGYPKLSAVELARPEARAKLGLPDSVSTLLFFGIVRPYKGLKVLLEALSILNQEAAKPHLIIAGEFWEDLAMYQSIIRDLDLADQVHIYNRYIPNEEVGDFFTAADVLVAPYVEGTQSAVVSLGFGYGTPMIVSEVAAEGLDGDQRSVVTIVPTNDAQSLAGAIREFIANPPPAQTSLDDIQRGWNRIISALIHTTNR